ncbi:sensor histidine kinase [Ideonella sp. DXS22W]|uniref:histidine kinase n=1 Tax=Pseudaquabacterium inlustre TaxID=2984192 RepID=A0ABU9CQJ9_9BURK
MSPPSTGSARSLHRQLLLWLLLPQGVLWIAAAIFTYQLAQRYANEAIDASLLQASRALARQVKPISSGLYIDFPRSAQDILESDPTDRVLYTVSMPPGQLILGHRHLPAPPPAVAQAPVLGEPHFYDSQLREPQADGRPGGPEPVRVVALYLRLADEGATSGTMLVQVARSRANRELLARRIVLDTALPLSGVMVLMTLIVWAGIRAGLQPLALLQRQVEGRAANSLAPIRLDAAPPEVRALAQAINTLLGEVGQQVQVQKRFISDAAHQLRTPLAGLKSQTELALREAGADAALRARLQRVHESATRSAHLVAQLLTLARAEPESARQQPRSRVDLQRLAQEVTAELVPRALAAGVDLGFEAPDAAPEDAPGSPATAGAPPAVVNGIALLLREALVNLVDNATHYAGRGAAATVRVRRDGASVLLEVEDNGPGLPEADRERVFERFVRATHDGAGCGLGLAIVREIVQRHDGRVQLLPARPHGLLARVTLPAAEG